MSTPNVVRIVTRLNVGGPTRHITLVHRGLRARGVQETILAGPVPPDEGPHVLDVGAPIHLVPELARSVGLVKDLRAFLHLVRVLRELRPDVVHTHQSKAGLLGRLAAWWTGVPRVIHTHHGLVFEGYFGAAGRAFVRIAERVAASLSDVVICQDPLQVEDLIKALGPRVRSRVRMVPPAVEVPERPLLPTGRRVVFPARLVPVKDPLLALRVFERLDADVQLDVVGDGPLRAEMEQAVRRHADLARRVTFHGHLADPYDVYRRARVGLLTSVSEGTPLALLELMILGVRVVAPNVGAISNLVPKEGGRVVPREEDALVEAVTQMLAASPVPPETRRALREHHGADRLVDALLGLYSE